MLNVVASFYQFVTLPDPAAIQTALTQYCEQLMLRGTVLLSTEGINGNLAGLGSNIDALILALQNGTAGLPRFDRLELKYSTASNQHFDRLKIRVKPEIITFGRPLTPQHRTGTYVPPSDWNNLLDDPATILLDTRNGFEFAMGRFAGATNPGLTSFSDFPDFVTNQLTPAKHKKIAMYCTGGIRCEKAGAYLLQAGFPEVYHLQGGILKYLELIPPHQSKWQGDCFVFDRRIALGHGLQIVPPPDIKDSLDSARPNIAE